MKASIVGAGAIGGSIGFGLARAGCEVSGIARGRTLAALREKGLRFTDGGHVEAVFIHAVESAGELGVQDLVVLAVKAPALTEVAPLIVPLLGPGTIVLPAMNGVPWWFFQGFGGRLAGTSLEPIDPRGIIASKYPPGRHNRRHNGQNPGRISRRDALLNWTPSSPRWSKSGNS